ncbi:MAG: LysR family transcriptional regulator [Coriobacteriales bacterium]|nr:LysR family transcriptional regulator [Coriobacteriales bacterium]
MELRTLRSFLAVAQEGNVTRAARQLHITQPALSRQLSELEREMGCELLVRESRGVTLTEQGILLRKRADEIVSLADRAERELRAPSAEVEGDVWVGGGESRAMAHVAQVAKSISTKHPGVCLHIHSGNGADVIERVDKGLLDFGIVFGDTPNRRYESLQLPHEDRWGVLMRHDHPLASKESLTLEDLRNERLVVSGEGSALTEGSPTMFQGLASEGFDIAATYTLLYNASLLVEAGMGLAVCFDGIVAAGEGTPFAYVPLTDVSASSAYLIWKRFQPLSRACELFLHGMREVCAASEQ